MLRPPRRSVLNVRGSVAARPALAERRDTIRARGGTRGIAAGRANAAAAMTGPATSAWPRLIAAGGPRSTVRHPQERGGGEPVLQYTQIMMCTSVSLGTPGPTARDRAGRP